MVGCILATDMAKHTEDFELFKRCIEQKGISADQGNGELFIDKTTATSQFDTQ